MGAKRITGLVILGLSVGLPGAAAAGEAVVLGGAVEKATDVAFARFTAAPGESNRLSLTASNQPGGGRRFVFHDAGAPITSYCDRPDPNTAVCDAKDGAEVLLGDGDDQGTTYGTVEIYGEEGDDALLGRSLKGGPGSDALTLTGPGLADSGPGPWRDTVRGSDGDDEILDGGDGERDQFEGGPGTDTLSYYRSGPPVTVRLGGAGNEDEFAGIEAFRGTGSNDTFIGDAGANSFGSGGGFDTMFGNDGPDHLSGGSRMDGGAGDDLLDYLAGRNDGVSAGSGNDTIATEGDDRISCGGGRDLVVATPPGVVRPVALPADCERATLGGAVTVIGRPRRVGRSLLVRVTGRPKAPQRIRAVISPNPVGISRPFTGGGSIRIPLDGRGRRSLARGSSVYLHTQAARRADRKRTPSLGLKFRIR